MDQHDQLKEEHLIGKILEYTLTCWFTWTCRPVSGFQVKVLWVRTYSYRPKTILGLALCRTLSFFIILPLKSPIPQNGQTHSICRLLLTNGLSVFDHFVGLVLKELKLKPCLYEKEPSPANPSGLSNMTINVNSELTAAFLVKVDNFWSTIQFSSRNIGKITIVLQSNTTHISIFNKSTEFLGKTFNDGCATKLKKDMTKGWHKIWKKKHQYHACLIEKHG